MNTDYHWITQTGSFNKIQNDTYKLEIQWSKKVKDDLIKLSQHYFYSGYKICSEIVEGRNNNEKNDMWFLPCVYLLRHSIELLIKAGLAKEINHKPKLQKKFIEGKHNLALLFRIYKMNVDDLHLTTGELDWTEKYLASIEVVDKNSDLFRYSFKDEFLLQYEDEFLDIVVMANRLLQCYKILSKCILRHVYEENEINLEEIPEFLSFSSHGIGNCYLWESPYGNGFYKQVTGYSNTGEFLFRLYQQERDTCYVYPMIFLLRNAIELGLKQLLYANTDIRINERKIKQIKNTHLLYKELWLNIKPILTHYGKKQGYDLKELDIAEKYLREVNALDKNGDTFRYPFTYSFEYKWNNKLIDVENVCIYLQSIFNFLDGCNSMLDDIFNYEGEMRSYYE